MQSDVRLMKISFEGALIRGTGGAGKRMAVGDWVADMTPETLTKLTRTV